PNSLAAVMRTLLVLAALTLAVCLGEEDEIIVEKRDTTEEVFQLRNKRCTQLSCENTDDMSNTLRHVFLNAHNDMRQSIAEGTEVSKNGMLPRATNMYKLKWSCDLESQARAWASKCENLEADHIMGQGQNFVIIEKFSGDIPNTITKKLGEWRKEVMFADLDDEIRYNIALNIQEWANMANAETTKVGCSVHKCGESLALSCFYNKAGDIPDHIIFESGSSCTYDYDCTTHENSYCVPLTGLCYQKALKKSDADAVAGYSSHICPRNAKMTDSARHTVVDWHNAFRSNLAFGKEEDGEGSYAPMARGMLKMHYDCVLERSAQEAVERCRFAPYKINKGGENIFVTEQEDARQDQITILQQATKQWWDELKQGGIGYNNTFGRKDITNHVDHFTQMAWSATYRVGCATKNCGGKYFAVCHYSPSGNKFGQKVYTYGNPCKVTGDCDVGQTCSVEEGLCVVTLA
ncbi:hypothetical protein PFISCL1PPCAC_26921, partial [Pristionchus fissidentatus]